MPIPNSYGKLEDGVIIQNKKQFINALQRYLYQLCMSELDGDRPLIEVVTACDQDGAFKDPTQIRARINSHMLVL